MTGKPDYRVRASDGVCCTNTAQAALGVLLSDEFGQIGMPEYYERLANELGRDFKNVRFMAKYMPLFYDGAEHRALRKRAAEFVRQRAEALAQMEQDAAALFKQKLSQSGKVEVISEIITPIFGMAALAISGLRHFPDAMRVFTANNSLRVLRKLDADIGMLRQLADAHFPDDDTETQGLRVAFSTLGVEPLGASIAASFAMLVEGAEGVPIRALPWQPHFLATGLKTVGRESRNGPVNLGPGAEAVQVCEVDLGRFLEAGAQPNHIFGVGAHSCLGRNSALSLWAGIGKDLAQNQMRIRHIGTSPSVHKILDFPSKILIEVFP